jgi:hypothetical protein
LLAPQPPARPVRKPLIRECPWQAGDIVAYELASGRQLIFAVRNVHRDKGGAYPTITPVWTGDALPDAKELVEAGALRVRREWVDTFNKKLATDSPYYPLLSDICLLALPNKTPKRFRALSLTRPMEKRLSSGNAVLFKGFDAYLEKVFGLS